MVTIEEITLHNFFSIGDAVVKMEGRGLVLVHGRVGAGKTALICESVLYALYGTSLEYGQMPGQSVKKNTEDSFSVAIRLRADDSTFRIVRGKSGKLNGVALFRIEIVDGVEVEREFTCGTSRDTQKLITGSILKMSERLFRRSVMCSTDMSKFPDVADSEKKSVFDELLELWKLQKAHEETTDILKKLRGEADAIAISLERASEKLESLRAAKPSHSLVKLKKARAAGESEIEELNAALTAITEKRNARRSRLKTKLASLEKVSVPESLVSRIATLREQLRSAKAEAVRIAGLVQAGKCPKCGQDTSCLTEHGEVAPVVTEAVEAELRKALDSKSKYDTRAAEAAADILAVTQKLDDLSESYDSSRDEINAEISSLENQVASISTMVRDYETYEQRVADAEADVESLTARLKHVDREILDEEVLEKMFSPKGCKINIIQSVIPFLNQEADRITSMLNTPIRVQFSIRGGDQSFTGQFSVDVHNPIGAWQYHGSSAGERRTIDLIILMCFMSMVGKRSTRFNQAFFDETFEKLDPPLQRAVLKLLREIASTKSSVFLITHAADEIRQEVDETWEVHRGGAIMITKN